MPENQRCLNRQSRLLNLIPFSTSGDYPDTATLLEKMGDSYASRPRQKSSASCADSDGVAQTIGPDDDRRALSSASSAGSDRAARKRIERDLHELLETGQIEVANPGGKRRIFRRLANDVKDDPRLHDYIRALSEALLKESLPSRRHEKFLEKSRDGQNRPLLPEARFRVIGDSQRLLPAEIKLDVLIAVLSALIQRQVLQVGYRKQDGSLLRPRLHPQGLLQRGPVLYLYALKNDEETVKMFALHRMTSAKLLAEMANDDPDFDLDQRIFDGDADYGRGEEIVLKLRVRGYVLAVLRDCPLSEDQCIEEEMEETEEGAEEDDDPPALLRATVPATGQLYRWLLGCGAHVEVLEPPHLRAAVAKTVARMSAHYR